MGAAQRAKVPLAPLAHLTHLAHLASLELPGCEGGTRTRTASTPTLASGAFAAAGHLGGLWTLTAARRLRLDNGGCAGSWREPGCAGQPAAPGAGAACWGQLPRRPPTPTPPPALPALTALTSLHVHSPHVVRHVDALRCCHTRALRRLRSLSLAHAPCRADVAAWLIFDLASVLRLTRG